MAILMALVGCRQEFPTLSTSTDMRPETENTIALISSSPMFQNVGKPIVSEVKQVTSWTQAVRCCQRIEWQSVQLQVNNLLAMRVSQADYSRLQAWRSTLLDSINHA